MKKAEQNSVQRCLNKGQSRLGYHYVMVFRM